MSLPVLVIGSGPAGATAAHALTQAGKRVVMLDAGNIPEESVHDLMYQGGQVKKEGFLKKIYKNRKNSLGSAKGLPEKLAFGSLYPYKPYSKKGDFSEVSQEEGVSFVTSHALGGLSNVWGATVAGLSEKDTDLWPITASELSQYFEKLKSIVDVSANKDSLDLLYPSVISETPHYELGSQGQHLLQGMNKNQEALQKEGIYHGRAKIAVGPKYASNHKGCVECGLCMHGCPYNAIFNSADVVHRLRKSPSFDYVSGVFVKSFEEKADGVEVSYVDPSGIEQKISGERLFIGAGVIGSTAIVSRSLNWSKSSFSIQDSQKYIFFFKTASRIRGAVKEDSNSLSQIYLELQNEEISKRTVHVQLYGYSDIFIEPLRRFLPEGVMKIVPEFTAPIFERLMVGMMYLHSDDSGELEFTPSKDLSKNQGSVKGQLSKRGDEVFSKTKKLFDKNKSLLGGSILGFGVQTIPCGKSQHFGASLPMCKSPKEGETDLLGRPKGAERVHVVDTSVLPSVPGTPTTYPIMANAWRIVEESLGA